MPTSTADEARQRLLGLKMARSLEALDDVLRSLEQGSLSALEAIHQLLAEEFQTRETRRIKAGLMTADEIGYLPLTKGGANLFFQPVNASYERGAMTLTSNRAFKEWGEIFGDNLIAAALLDRLLHHVVVIKIDGNIRAAGHQVKTDGLS